MPVRPLSLVRSTPSALYREGFLAPTHVSKVTSVHGRPGAQAVGFPVTLHLFLSLTPAAHAGRQAGAEQVTPPPHPSLHSHPREMETVKHKQAHWDFQHETKMWILTLSGKYHS